jgi:CheY-like chemotaxis protein
MNDLIPYIGIAVMIAFVVGGLVVLKRNGVAVTRLKHEGTEMEFEHLATVAIGAPAAAAQPVKVLELKVEMSPEARNDCKTLGIPPKNPIQFVRGEAARHPLMFAKDFTSLQLVFHENVLLLSWEYSVATIERILNRSEAYPLNDDWTSCLAVYRQATLLPYRTKGIENLRNSAEAQRVLAIYRRLVTKANDFLESLKRNQQHPFEAYGDLRSLIDEGEFALASEDFTTAAVRLELVLSTVHKLIIQNAPQGPLSSSDSAKTMSIEISPDAKAAILLVDDDMRWLHSIRHLLESKNFAIVVASTTGDALRAIVDHEFDLVITDLVMGLDSDSPEADGREVAIAAKKGSRKTKVVVLTAYSRMSLMASLSKAGVDLIIDKAELTEVIVDKIESTLAKRDERRAD